MITNVKDYTDVLCRLKISPNQFYICWLIHSRDRVSTIKYYEENQFNRFTPADIEELLRRDFLLSLTKDKSEYNLDCFTVTPKFTDSLIVDEDEAGEELWNTFPSWLMVKQNKVSAKSCDKDDLIEKYAKKIKGSFKKHKKVMSALEEYIKRNNGYATMGIEKFVNSEQWTLLEQEYKDNPETGDLTKAM